MSTRVTPDHHLDIDALGVTIRIDVGGLPPVDRELLADAWSGALTTSERTPAGIVRPRPHFHFDETVADLTTQVTLAALEARRGQLWMVHAGAVAHEDGRVILFSGRSGMGKTTLMSQLAREFGYVTDESVGVTSDGRVLPYRKPLSVIVDGARAKRQLSPETLGLRELPPVPLRLHAIVVLDRHDDGIPARMEDLDIADALEAIAPQCSFLAELEAPLRTMIGHISRAGGAVRLRYREAADVLTLVGSLFDTERNAPVTSGGSEPVPRPDPHSGPSHGTTFSRSPVIDAVVLSDERLALLRRGLDAQTMVHLIGGIGPALWTAAAECASFDDLVTAAVRAYGRPPSGHAAEAVQSALDAMVSAGLMELSTPRRVREETGQEGEEGPPDE